MKCLKIRYNLQLYLKVLSVCLGFLIVFLCLFYRGKLSKEVQLKYEWLGKQRGHINSPL